MQTEEIKYLSRKTYAMIVIGSIGILAIVTNGIFAWFYNPQDPTTINSVIEFLKNIVLTVIGYLAGASRPDDGKTLSTLKSNSLESNQGSTINEDKR
jgi:hypothetical protein